ncbi:hypothetical protein P691DRAFT_760577 [Macrolepiota fuliginosa MF-IS2]|uniref:Uncharacterized protein n=1 Tax=Macrolepiota fuliginosa MF-IS2 TaxID=1400762 RepID=A0A9P6C3E9_9AGAR|nr:hypothetical protein P691DRAFT_760577 [Macrolepiota fuliginosa MF-IS2]
MPPATRQFTHQSIVMRFWDLNLFWDTDGMQEFISSTLMFERKRLQHTLLSEYAENKSVPPKSATFIGPGPVQHGSDHEDIFSYTLPHISDNSDNGGVNHTATWIDGKWALYWAFSA